MPQSIVRCLAGTQPNLRDGHLFSLFLMLPLAYVTLALLLFNWYPSQVGHSRARSQSCENSAAYAVLSWTGSLCPPVDQFWVFGICNLCLKNA